MVTKIIMLADDEPRLAGSEQVKPTPGKWDFGAIYPMSGTSGGHVTVHEEMGISHYVVRSRFQDNQDRRVTVFVAQVQITSGREKEVEANARLIAAAPDLLAALKLLVENEESGAMFSERIQMALAAIAKAEGRTP